MARLIPWPENERGKAITTQVGIQAVHHGRTITQSIESGREHLIDREPLRWGGTVSLAPTNSKVVAQRIEQMLDLLAEPDCYTHMPVMNRRAGFFDEIDAGTGGAKITVKALIPQADGLYVLLSPKAAGRTKDTVDGRLTVNPAVGDYFQFGDRLCRVGAVKFGEAASTALVAASSAAAGRPAVLVEPAIAQDWEIGAEVKQASYVRARIPNPPVSVAGPTRRGAWPVMDWSEYIPEPPSARTTWNRIGELMPFSVPAGGTYPISVDRLWFLRPGAGLSVEATTAGDRVSFPALAGVVQNVKGRRAGPATVTLTLYGPDGAELDTQHTTALVTPKDANSPPGLISSVPRMGLDVGETKYVVMSGVVADADETDGLDYTPTSSNGTVASVRRYGDRIGPTGRSPGVSVISALVEDSSGAARLVSWTVDVAQVGTDEERPGRLEGYRDPPAVALQAHKIGDAARPQSAEYDAGDYFRGPNPFRISVQFDNTTTEVAEVRVVGRKWRFLAGQVTVLGANANAAGTWIITATDTRTQQTAERRQVVNLTKEAQGAPVWLSRIPDQTIYDPAADTLEIPLAGRVVDPDGDALVVSATRPSGDAAKLTVAFVALTGPDAPGRIDLDRLTAKGTDGGTVTVTVPVSDGTRSASPVESFVVNLPSAASAEADGTDLEWADIPAQRHGVGSNPSALDLTPYLSAETGAPAPTTSNTRLSVVSSDTTALRATVSGFSVTPIPVASRDIAVRDLTRNPTLTVRAQRTSGTKRGIAEAEIAYTIIQHNVPPRFTGPSPADIRLKVGGITKTINLDEHSTDPDNPPSRRTYTHRVDQGPNQVDLVDATSLPGDGNGRNEEFTIAPLAAGTTTLHITMRSTVGDRTTEYKQVTLIVDPADAPAPPQDDIAHTPLPDYPLAGTDPIYPGDTVTIDGTDFWEATGNSGSPREWQVRRRADAGFRLIENIVIDHRTGLIEVIVSNSPEAASGGVAEMQARARSVGGNWVPLTWDDFNIAVSRRAAVALPSFREIPEQSAVRGAAAAFTLSLPQYANIPSGFGAVAYSGHVEGAGALVLVATVNAATGLVTIPVRNALAGRFTITVGIASTANQRLAGAGSFQLVIKEPTA